MTKAPPVEVAVIPYGTVAILLHRSWAGAYGYLPVAFDRIGKFCAKYEDETPAALLCETLLTEFSKEAPGMIVVLSLRPNGTVRGHALVHLEQWMSGKKATVLQMETDEYVSRADMDAAWSCICKWAEANGAPEIQIFARDHKLARVFRTFYGFKERRVLMARPPGPLTGVKNVQA